ncbi:TonB-dependent receptor [Sphingomonas swuensis]|uniref:TonB-dependent receptor n=1 Tax=Sphingomonas swuensis TaxID=977800 RepID=A0ABP7TET7_9SPHN
MIDQPSPPPIVITARALPPLAGEAVQDVVVLGRPALERAPSQALEDIVRAVPGVQLFRRSGARSANPTTQGISARGLGGNAASRMVVLLDGVPQGDPFGGWLVWPSLDAAGLAEVRVTRGGGNVTVGPGALAGAIELDSDRTPGLRAALDGGLHGAGEARLAAVHGGTSLAAWGGTDAGFIPVVAEDRGVADRRSPFAYGGTRLGLRAGAFSAAAALFADRRERGLPGTANASRGADLSLRWRRANRGSVTLFHQERRFESAFASASADRSSVSPTLSQFVPAKATGWNAEWQPLATLRLGTDGRVARGASEEEASFVAGRPTRDRVAEGRQATAGLYGDLTLPVGSVTLSGALRVDRWWLRGLSLEERNRSTGALLLSEQAPDREGTVPSGRVGARLPLGRALTLRGAAYLGWRLPTLNELVRPFRVGRDAVAANAALKPERLRGIEAGAEWKRGPWSASATLFANRLRNPIINVTRGTGPGTFPGVGFVAGTYRRRENVAALDTKGVEAALGWSRGDWRASGTLSMVSAHVRDSGPLDGLRPAQVPRLTATAEIGWRELGLQLRHVGAQNEDDLGTLRLPAATTLDASASWPLRDGLALRVRGENLTNARVLAARSADGIDERATPRRLWLGLTLRR